MVIHRKILSIALLAVITISGFTLSSKVNISFADNPNDKSTFHSLTGGWDKNFLGTSGKHWTKFDQKSSTGKIYASITLQGYDKETTLGSFKSAYVKSTRSVDYYHTHYHTGGMTR